MSVYVFNITSRYGKDRIYRNVSGKNTNKKDKQKQKKKDKANELKEKTTQYHIEKGTTYIF